MKTILALMTSIVMICTPVYSEEIKLSNDKPFQFQKGKSYTFDQDGWAFTILQEREMRYRLIDADYLEKELKLNEQLVDNYKQINETQEQISLKYKAAWEESNKTLTDILKREGRTKFWYMTLGVLLTVGAGLAIGFSAKAIK